MRMVWSVGAGSLAGVGVPTCVGRGRALAATRGVNVSTFCHT